MEAQRNTLIINLTSRIGTDRFCREFYSYLNIINLRDVNRFNNVYRQFVQRSTRVDPTQEEHVMYDIMNTNSQVVCSNRVTNPAGLSSNLRRSSNEGYNTTLDFTSQEGRNSFIDILKDLFDLSDQVISDDIENIFHFELLSCC